MSLSDIVIDGLAPERVAIGDVQTKSALAWSIALSYPEPVVECTAVVSADRTVTIAWTGLELDEYFIRLNGGFEAAVGAVDTYTDDPGPGTHEYVVRYRLADQTIDLPCQPAVTVDAPPPVVQSCSAVVGVDGSVVLSWDAIAGEDSYVVRRNDSWLATTGELSYTDNTAQPGDTHVIRSKLGGVTTETACVE